MGVLGLTPFILKTCPDVIKQLPDRLRGLAGKTIVIDGTLVTQRLHFAQMPHMYRHVLGWYRVIKELNDYGVTAICVFDGKERSLAKAREAERRKEVQRLAVARGSIEIDRLKRLRRLVGLLDHFRTLEGSDRKRVTGLFRQMTLETNLMSNQSFPSWYQNGGHFDLLRYIHNLVNSDDQHPSPSSASQDVSPRTSHLDDENSFSSEAHKILRDQVEQLLSAPPPDLGLVMDPFASQDHVDSLPNLEPSFDDRPTHTTYREISPPMTREPTLSPSHTKPTKSPHEPLTPSSPETFIPPIDNPAFWESDSEIEYESSLTPELFADMAVNPFFPPDEASTGVVPRVETKSSIIPNDYPPPIHQPKLQSSRHVFYYSEPPWTSNQPSSTQLQDQPFSFRQEIDHNHQQYTLTPESPIPAEKPASTVADILTALASLYIDYRNSIPKLVSLSARLSSPSPISTPPATEDAVVEARPEYVMTKSQYQLTLDEGKLWKELAGFPASGTRDPNTIDTQTQAANTTAANLASLAEKSSLMSESYQRRTNPPTMQTYDECKEILQAMGVPCIESAGTFEGEALASSLVISGLADYVASEDTDVLVYGAPLIRNITNRQEPLVIVSGADVRAVLQLDRTSFIDFALLLGTDFSQRIKNVGPARALKFIREHGSIERIIELETKFPPRVPKQVYLQQVEDARLVFQTLPPVPDQKSLEPRKIDEEEVMQILQRYGLHRAAMYDWDYEAALDGNYFEDNPSAY